MPYIEVVLSLISGSLSQYSSIYFTPYFVTVQQVTKYHEEGVAKRPYGNSRRSDQGLMKGA